MRGAAQRVGRHATTIQASRRGVCQLGRLSPCEQSQVAEWLCLCADQGRARAQAWIAKAQQGRQQQPASCKQLLAWLQAQSGDYAAIARDAAGASGSPPGGQGQRPSEADLLRLADAQQRGNLPGYAARWTKLAYLLSEEGLLGRRAGPPAAQERLRRPLPLDVMRLKLASGTMTKTEDFMEMAQLALQAGYPAEATRSSSAAMPAAALGTGAEAERHKRLRDLADKQFAESSAGIAARRRRRHDQGRQRAGAGGTVYVSMGEVDKGLR